MATPLPSEMDRVRPRRGDVVLKIAALGEATTGLALVIAPSTLCRLLLGEELAGGAIPAARVAGIALVGLGMACWPGKARLGMLTYGAAVAVYLAYVGITGVGGPLLWPAVVVHAILSASLLRHLQDGGGRS